MGIMLTRYPALDDVLNLGFAPVANHTPRAFTPVQIEQFNEQGFVAPGPALLR